MSAAVPGGHRVEQRRGLANATFADPRGHLIELLQGNAHREKVVTQTHASKAKTPALSGRELFVTSGKRYAASAARRRAVRRDRRTKSWTAIRCCRWNGRAANTKEPVRELAHDKLVQLAHSVDCVAQALNRSEPPDGAHYNSGRAACSSVVPAPNMWALTLKALVSVWCKLPVATLDHDRIRGWHSQALALTAARKRSLQAASSCRCSGPCSPEFRYGSESMPGFRDR